MIGRRPSADRIAEEVMFRNGSISEPTPRPLRRWGDARLMRALGRTDRSAWLAALKRLRASAMSPKQNES